MFKDRSNQAGFGVVEVVTVVVVLALLGGSGYLIYKAHTKNATPPSTSTKTTTSKAKAAGSQSTTQKTTKPPASASTAYFTIKEWGVQAPYSGSDLTYSAAPDSSSEMLLESKEIDATVPASDTSCKAGNAGNIGRYSPTDTIPGVPPQPTAQQYVNEDFTGETPPTYAHIGNYYYIYWPPTAGCSTDATPANQATAAAANIVSHLESIQ